MKPIQMEAPPHGTLQTFLPIQLGQCRIRATTIKRADEK